MTEASVWQECWQQLRNTFASVADELRRCNPELWSQVGHRTGDVYPFEAWVELLRVKDPSREVDITVFFAVERVGDTLTCRIDISTGEGLVLVDGPTRVVTVDDAGAWQDEVLAYAAGAEQFLRENHHILRDALC